MHAGKIILLDVSTNILEETADEIEKGKALQKRNSNQARRG